MTKLEVQSKVMPITAEKKIQWIPFNEELVVYKEQLIFNTEVFTDIEGIALKEDVLNAHHLNHIKEYSVEEGANKISYHLFTKDCLEFIRKNPLSYKDNAPAMYKMLVDNPFTFVEANGIEDLVLLHVDFGNYRVYDINYNLVPQAIYFSYFGQNIDNYYYDLDEFLSVLKNRNDINIFPDRNGKEIKDIDWFNSEDHRSKHIEFIWSPTAEDYAKIQNYWKEYDRYKLIVEEIFGMKQLEYFEEEPLEDE